MRLCSILLFLFLTFADGSVRKPSPSAGTNKNPIWGFSGSEPQGPIGGSLSPQISGSEPASLRTIQAAVDSMQLKLDQIGWEVSATKEKIDQSYNAVNQLLKHLLKSSCSDAAVAQTGPISNSGASRPGIDRQESSETILTISLPSGQVKRVKCDVSSSGDGGWTVALLRQDGSVPFNRTMIEYQRGFGDPTGELWIGLDALHEITSSKPHQLRVEMEKFSGESAFALYKEFRVGSSEEDYRLKVGRYDARSSAGDALMEHNRMAFSTIDSDKDRKGRGNCAYLMGGGGGWWYKNCYHALGTGRYRSMAPGQKQMPLEYGGVTWHPFNDVKLSLKSFKMLIKPSNL